MRELPEWINSLDDEDLNFVKRFILSSGSLKEVAKLYGVTYPTVRLRLDRLIEKIVTSSDNSSDSYIDMIKKMALEDKLDFNVAKVLIKEYKKQKNNVD